MRQRSNESLIKMPELSGSRGSLSALEKSLLGHFIALTRPQIIVELGVLEGATTKFILEFLTINKIHAHLIGFDFPDVVSNLRKSNKYMQQKEKDGLLQLIPGELPASLIAWLKSTEETIDLALVDASHSYKNVIDELGLLWPKLSPDGYILCHDYSRKYEGVRYAVDRFAHKRNVMVLPLSASDRAIKSGHGSVLVALCKRSHSPTTRGWLQHLWLGAKKDLLRNPVFEKVWSALVKPTMRGGNR